MGPNFTLRCFTLLHAALLSLLRCSTLLCISLHYVASRCVALRCHWNVKGSYCRQTLVLRLSDSAAGNRGLFAALQDVQQEVEVAAPATS